MLKLTPTQEEFVKSRFIQGEELLNRIEKFEKLPDAVKLSIVTDISKGIVVASKYKNDCIWFDAFSNRVIVKFNKIGEKDGKDV